MKRLQTIQKTFAVFQMLSKAAMILAFVYAGFLLIGVLCGVIWCSGGIVIGADQEMLLALTSADSPNQMIGLLLSDLVFALTDGILFLFAFLYFKQEQADGTPFTQQGAELVKRLGIRTIVLPLVAVILSAMFCRLFDLPAAAGSRDNLASLSMGIALILASLVLRYGAELEEANGTD